VIEDVIEISLCGSGPRALKFVYEYAFFSLLWTDFMSRVFFAARFDSGRRRTIRGNSDLQDKRVVYHYPPHPGMSTLLIQFRFCQERSIVPAFSESATGMHQSLFQ
jgi:hypothetical protein